MYLPFFQSINRLVASSFVFLSLSFFSSFAFLWAFNSSCIPATVDLTAFLLLAVTLSLCPLLNVSIVFNPFLIIFNSSACCLSNFFNSDSCVSFCALARFVIFDEKEEIEIKATKAAIKRKVLVEAEKLTPSRKAEIIQILLGKSVRNQSNDFIDLQLDECIDQKGAETVLNLMNRDKAKVSLHATILEAIHKGVLRKEGSAIYYMDDQLGFDLESTLDYLSDKKNQALKAQILEKLN